MVDEKTVWTIIEKGRLTPAFIDRVESLSISIRPLYMCKFGCPEYGKYPSCPPYVGSIHENRAFVREYEYFVLVTTPEEFGDDFDGYKRMYQERLLNIQKDLIKAGYFYAFALFPGSCRLCKVCGMPDTCYRRSDVRPSVSAMGIELLPYLQSKETVLQKLNISLHTRRLFSIIFLE